MKITTAAEMREIDRATTERFGVPSLTLMENAGSAIAQFILEQYGRGEPHRRGLRQGQQRRRWLRGRAQAASRGTRGRGAAACRARPSCAAMPWPCSSACRCGPSSCRLRRN